jgi:hypothetical protein
MRINVSGSYIMRLKPTQIVVGGRIVDEQLRWSFPNDTKDDDVIFIGGRAFSKFDIETAFCDRQTEDNWECPYIRHISGTYYDPPEDYCPAEFTPSYIVCGYHEGFLEMLEEMNITIDEWWGED